MTRSWPLLPSLLTLTFASACAPSPGPTKRPVAPPAASSAPRLAPPVASAPAAPLDPESAARATHALHRLSYGPRPGDVEAVARAGVTSWISAQLRPETLRDEPTDEKLRALPTLTLSTGELHVRYPKNGVMTAPPTTTNPAPPANAPGRPAAIVEELMAAKVLRAASSERALQEVLVDFWFNHFNVFAEKDELRWLVTSYEREALRPHLFGRFRDLLGAVASHPAMLIYLDNWRRVAETTGPPNLGKKPRGLNENYARELLELHTLGVDGGYTQSDVREVARAFTGWTVERPHEDATFLFRPAMHDRAAKVVLGQAITGSGRADGDQVLDLLAAHGATARFLAIKLARKFVADVPPSSLVDRLAATFTRTGGNLTAVYAELFAAPEFWSSDARGAKVKTPFELAVSALRAVGAIYDGSPALGKRIDRLGELVYRCQPPIGYKDISDAWISSGALVARINFGLDLASNCLPGVVYRSQTLTGDAAFPDTEHLVDRLALTLLHTTPSPATRATVLASLARHGTTVDYQEPSPTQLPQSIGLLLGSPEFQRQ